jgi:3-oxoacyl-[acyl-carrier-protein] synthase I
VHSLENALAVIRYTGVNCLGRGVDAWWKELRTRSSGLTRCAFEDVRLSTWIGEVSGLEDERLPEHLRAFDCRNNRLAQAGLAADGFADAVATARERYGPARIAVVMGTSTSGILSAERAYQRRDSKTGTLPADFQYAGTQNNFSLAAFVRNRLQLTGPAHVISTACSSSAKVFASAARMIECGLADAAVVGGADSLCMTTLYGFNALELLSPDPCRPFDRHRSGISIGEGAAFALLARDPLAEIVLAGWGESADAYHMSTPHPEGLGARLAMARALASANLDRSDIGYVNAHGTASRTNDPAEGQAIAAVFGPELACSATKGATGHLLGTAGITEAIIVMLALSHGFLPGTANTQTVDASAGCRILVEGERSDARFALTNSFGFGGNNCSLVFGRRGSA